MDKYYRILGLQPGADKDAIKRAYRKLAMRYHPDRNPGKAAKEKFLEVLEAYEYLTGIRQVNFSKPSVSREDLNRMADLMKKVAEEKARAKYRERVKELRKEREREQAREYQKAIFLLIGIIVISFASWQGYKWYYNLMVNSDPVNTEAVVVGFVPNRVIYRFQAGDKIIQDRDYVSNYKLDMLADNGMPLKLGDRFEIVYRKGDPSYHQLNFDKVSGKTLARYLNLATIKLLELYSVDWQEIPTDRRKIRAQCISHLVLQEFGIDGLATIYYADCNPLENFSNNNMSWYFMRRGDDYHHILGECDPDSSIPQ